MMLLPIGGGEESTMKKQKTTTIPIPTTTDDDYDDDDDDTLLSALGDELAMEILIRLPVKSLFRFKCVSTRWLRLISNPLFIRSYTTTSSTTNSSVPPIAAFIQQFRFSYPDGRFSDFADDQIRYYPSINSQPGLEEEEDILINYDNNFNFEFLGLKTMVVLSSSMGLLLCSDSRNNPTRYLVCNPITKQWLSLPVPPPHDYFLSAHLHCYNSQKDIDNNMPNKFSVFLFVCELPNPSLSTVLKVETFSSDTGEWRLSSVAHRCSLLRSISILQCRRIFNSTAYWIDLFDGTVAAYDLENGTLRFMPPAPGSHNWFSGCLSFSNRGEIMHYAESNVTSLRVWEFSGGEWSLKHTISLQCLIDDGDFGSLGVANFRRRPYLANRYILKPLAFHPFDPDIVMLHLTGIVVSCNIVKRKLEVVFNYNGLENTDTELIPYTPMLWPAPIPPVINRTAASLHFL